MKKDAYYFSHDANAQDDPKCMLLIDQLGMEGYGIFWALIEKLRSEKDYRLPLNIVNSLARRWGTSNEKVHAVIKNYGLFVVQDDTFFYSIRLQNSMEEKSAKARLSANYRWNHANALQPHSEGTADGMRNDANKGKERKGKKKRVYIPPTAERTQDFYKKQIAENESDQQINGYKTLVEYLYGKNPKKAEYKNVLSMMEQISFNQFVSMKETSEETGTTIKTILNEMENRKGLPQNNISVAQTAMNWMRRNAKREHQNAA